MHSRYFSYLQPISYYTIHAQYLALIIFGVSIFGFDHLYIETTNLDSLMILYSPWSLCIWLQSSLQ